MGIDVAKFFVQVARDAAVGYARQGMVRPLANRLFVFIFFVTYTPHGVTGKSLALSFQWSLVGPSCPRLKFP
jgi:hypothetical protein